MPETVYIGGLFIAAFVSIPIVNLATPLFAMALMVHLHKRLERAQTLIRQTASRHASASRRDHVSAPHFVGKFDDHPQLGPLLVLGQHVAFLGRGEAALRRQAQLIEAAYLVASSMRRLTSSFFSSLPDLVVTRPSTTILLPLGRKRSGSKPPARAVSYSRK